MKKLIKKIGLLGLLVFTQQVVFGQTWEVSCNNTQTCSGITIDIYDASSNLLATGIGVPGGMNGTCIVGGGAGCQSSAALPAYVVFNEGGCSVTVWAGTTQNCGASPPPTCNCTCITTGTNYQVSALTSPGSTCTSACGYNLHIYVY